MSRNGALVLSLLAAVSTAHAVDLFVQAEDAIVDGASHRAGYAFVDAADETADWANVNSCPNPGFPNAPGHFAWTHEAPAGAVPALGAVGAVGRDGGHDADPGGDVHRQRRPSPRLHVPELTAARSARRSCSSPGG